MKKYLSSIAFLTAIPAICLLLFYFAPQWRESAVHQEFRQTIAAAKEFTAEQKQQELEALKAINFGNVCRSTDLRAQEFVDKFELAGLCNDFKVFEWSLRLSIFTILVSALFYIVLLFLSRPSLGTGPYRAQKIFNNYRWAWICSLIVVFVALICQGALLVPLSYYSTVMTFGVYFPKIVAGVGLCALWGLVVVVRGLFKKIPLEFKEVAAQTVSPTQAPRLWELISSIAAKVGTEAPQEILLGLQPQFYVTDLSVRHSAGRSEGRVLYLSLPLLKVLQVEEVAAIVGHEMAHFKGNDTVLTRQLYPYKFKAATTAQEVAVAGFAGIPAIHILNTFFHSFENILMQVSRDREFLADQVGAEATSKEALASGLSKTIYYSHVWGLAYDRSLAQSGEAVESLYDAIRVELSTDHEFWQRLSEKSQAHPLDSHPPLRARLEKLNVEVSRDTLQTLIRDSSAIPKAFAQLLDDEKVQEITQSAKVEYETINASQSAKLQVQKADSADPEGRRLLEKYFPTVTYQKSTAYKVFCYLGIAVLLVAGVLIFASEPSDLGIVMLSLSLLGLGLFALALFRTSANAPLILKFDSIYLGSWQQPVMFSDIQNLSYMTNNGVTSMQLTFKHKIPNPKKHYKLFKKVKGASVVLSSYSGDSNKMIQKIHSYYTRQI